MNEESPCQRPPPPGLVRGVDQFNRHEFYDCHETLEELWRSEPDPVRNLYQGILQVAVGFYHLERGNYPGARLCLQRGISRLRSHTPSCQGVLVDRLVADAEEAATVLKALGPARIEGFERRLIPHIHLRPDAPHGEPSV